MNIAFTDTSLDASYWTAGPIYLRNLIQAIRCADPTVGLFTFPAFNNTRAEEWAKAIGADGVIWHTPPPRWCRDWALAFVARQFRQDMLPIEWTLRRARIDVIFSFPSACRFGSMPTLGWLPDFQHRHLPQLFHPDERARREDVLRDATQFTDRLVVMSDTLQDDFRAFVPQYAEKGRVLRPVAPIAQSIYERDPKEIACRYHLPEKFVYVPNQFWMHKNHETVLRAVKVLADRGVSVRVVCSGNSFDHRNPEYFANLAEKLSLWNLRENILYVGLIPHEDALALMRQSVCVLNPSLFEGWGYSAEEARAVGKRALLSDIPAHREQAPPRAAFFDPTDTYDLADNLEVIWDETRPGPDKDLETAARATSDDRIRAYGAGFLSIATEAILAKN